MPKVKYLFLLERIVPEIIAFILIVSFDSTTNFLVWLWYLILIRLFGNLAIVIHGLGHTLAIALWDFQLNTLNLANILENRSSIQVLQSLIPGQKIFVPLISQPIYLEIKNSNYIRLKAIGGIGCNILIASYFFLLAPHNFYSQVFVVANLIVAVTSFSDLEAFFGGTAEFLYCGNFGLIARRKPEDEEILLPSRMVEMSQIMGRETEVRGEQAGGGLVIARDGEQTVFVGKKIVNKKRENLTQSLEAAFAPVRKKAQTSGIKPTEDLILGAWHYRYATSGSAPTELETHWHEWMSARNEKVWQFDGKKWLCQEKNVNHRITHNGDFDAWEVFGCEVDNRTLGLWLERVLHTPNATKGDSPKIAGLLDLLVTQGMWYPAVRLAYQMAVANSIQSAFGDRNPDPNAPNTAPSLEDLASWANICEETFGDFSELPQVNCADLSPYRHILEKKLTQALIGSSSVAQWNEFPRIMFIKTAVDAFFENDLYRATRLFIERAKGSFGLVTLSTLEPSEIVLAAKGQPISIGFNWQEKYLVYASEPAAVDRILAQEINASRLDMEQQTGEVAKVGVEKIAIYSLEKQKELSEAALTSRWIAFADNPFAEEIRFSDSDNPDLVENDLQAIPQVLDKIKTTWQNPDSLNCKSAAYFAHLLIEKLQRYEQKRQKMLQGGVTTQIRKMATVDILITGEENSLWLGERFAENLGVIFPLLNVVAMSANEVLQQAKNNFSDLYLGRNSLVLAITQSGQTFSTVQVINTCDRLTERGVIGEIFILTGELSSFLNSTQGQGGLTAIASQTFLNDPHRQRVFINGSGRRTAEPTTVTVAAAGQTLTELLFYLVKRMQTRFREGQPFGLTLTPESLHILEQMKEDFLAKNVTRIIGITSTGDAIKSATKQKLIQSGRYWGQHVTETPLAWTIHALYVLITVGWAIPFGETIPLVKTAVGITANLLNLPETLLNAIAPAITVADILIYIFGSWLWTLIIRAIQGRQLLARMGKRTLVIGDISWVNQLLQNYVSKLFSLSYGIASLEVHGGNPQNNFLHFFGHRVVRGTLIFLGIPDGRRSTKLQEAENAVLMTAKQANGIKNISVGAEILVLGHNKAIANKGFHQAIILDSNDDSIYFRDSILPEQKELIEEIRESCFGATERLLASYVFFWALAKKVAAFPLLKYEYWKSQSRTKIMTTASPVTGLEPESFGDNKHPEDRKIKHRNRS